MSDGDVVVATALEWKQILMAIYKASRDAPRWDLVLECHDEEDRRYFEMLDRKAKRKNT